MYEVDISVASVAQGLEIHGQIEVVELVSVAPLDHLHHVLLVEAHRDVADHQGGLLFISV